MSSTGSCLTVKRSPAGIAGNTALVHHRGAEKAPTTANVMRQPTASPMARPIGRPKICAMDEPVAIMLMASAPWRVSTRREAMIEATDQNTACAQATTRRAQTK